MDDDVYIFEMFQQIMQLFEDDSPDSRMRTLSKNPRYAADDPVKAQYNREKR